MEKENKKTKLKIIVIIAILLIVVIGIMFVVINKSGNRDIAVMDTDIEKMLNEAKILDKEKLDKEKKSNVARAIEEYEGQTYIWTTKVTNILADYLIADGINVYLKDNSELTKLNKNDDIVVLGKLEDLNISIKFTSAYIVTDAPNLIWAVSEEKRYSTNRKFGDYTYNKETGVITGYEESGNGYPGTYTLEYDDKCNLLSKTKNNILYGTETTKYTYNEDNTAATQTINSDNEEKIANYSYEKDDRGRITKRTWVNTTGDNYTMVYTYEYDDQDRISKETQESPRSKYELTYKYDKRNNLVSEASKRLDKNESSSTTTYKYKVVGVKSNKERHVIDKIEIEKLYY